MPRNAHFWQIGLLGIVLSEYPDKSHNFRNYIFMTSHFSTLEPLGTMSYQTGSKRSPPFWLLIGARKTQVFRHQSAPGSPRMVKYLFMAKTKSFLGGTRREPRTHTEISSPSSSAYHSNIKEFYFPIRFTRHDFIALCLAILIPVTCIVLTMVSVLPALGAPPLPDFQDPTKVSNFNFGRPEEPAILISKLV